MKGFVEPGWCTRGHVGYILEGQAEVDFDGEIIRFSAGDGVFIPEGEENRHKLTVLSEFVRMILVEAA
jgi:mannose-6-phosphate isomerase-like protein (cupin superfamily)